MTSLTCMPKKGQPCFYYRSINDKHQLDTFLIENGGAKAHVEVSGKATFTTLRNGSPQTIYVMPNSWVRCLDKGQFTAVPDRIFQQQFELV